MADNDRWPGKRPNAREAMRVAMGRQAQIEKNSDIDILDSCLIGFRDIQESAQQSVEAADLLEDHGERLMIPIAPVVSEYSDAARLGD